MHVFIINSHDINGGLINILRVHDSLIVHVL